MTVSNKNLPQAGLYRPDFERENCGFGLIANMDGKPSHWLVDTAIGALARLTHRGAVAADGKTGDGCGLLLKKPDSFLKAIADEQDFKLADLYATGMVFLNTDEAKATEARSTLEAELKKAFSYYELGDKTSTRKTLEQLLANYPDTTEAGQAKRLLKKL